jgi:hypothetical protein
LDADRFVNGFLGNRERFREDAHRLKGIGNSDDVLLLVHGKFSLIAIESPDAPFQILSRQAQVGAVHKTGQALSAPAANREDGMVTRFYPCDGLPGFNNLTEHLVANHQFCPTLRSECPTA